MILMPTPEALAQAVRLLRAGSLVAFPTETVYGLGADAANPLAVAAIFRAKGRPADHPVIVHVQGSEALKRWAREVPEAARRLAARFWPGPLTLILPRAAGVPDAVTGGQDTVGLRCPAHPVAQALLAAFGGGIAAPSANRFGRVSPTTAQHVLDEFGSAVPLILDGGPCAVGVESTIVDLSRGRAVLLRPGGVSAEELTEVLGEPPLPPDPQAPRASGGLEAHYQPNAMVRVVRAESLDEALTALLAAGHRIAVWSRSLPGVVPSASWRWQAAPADAPGYARNLYASLRAMDDGACDRILIAEPPDEPAWAAVRDRLRRASAPRS